MALLLPKVSSWCQSQGMSLNIGKCAHISKNSSPTPLYINGEVVRTVASYDYLGFPVTSDGIDFVAHLKSRIEKAVARIRYISVHSDHWGIAHRTRVYKQYIAPMFEYGGPLIYAWLNIHGNKGKWASMVAGYPEIIDWICHARGRPYITANLLGLTSLQERFIALRTAYQWVLEQSGADNPLKRMIARSGSNQKRKTGFIINLDHHQPWLDFKLELLSHESSVKKALSSYLAKRKRLILENEAGDSGLTAIIPLETRKVPGLLLADISLSGSIYQSNILFQYRRGSFMYGDYCSCGGTFQRGHEQCFTLPDTVSLTRAERLAKTTMQRLLEAKPKAKTVHFTDVDFLLNTGQLDRAMKILSIAKAELKVIWGLGQRDADSDT